MLLNGACKRDPEGTILSSGAGAASGRRSWQSALGLPEPMLLRSASLLTSPEPDDGGGEAERECDRHFNAAELCGPRTDEPTCRHVGAIRNLRCEDSLRVNELDSQYRSGQQ